VSAQDSNAKPNIVAQLRWFLRPIPGTITIVVALLGLWFTYIAIAPPELSYSVRPSHTLITLETNKLDASIRTPSLTEIQFKNSGFRPLDATAFTDELPGYGKGLLINSDDRECCFLACNVSEMQPADRQEAFLKLINSGKIFVRAIDLNVGDSFSILIKSDKKPTNFRVFGHLSNAKIQKVEYSDWNSTLHNIWHTYLFFGATAGIAALILEVYFYFQIIEFVKWLAETKVMRTFFVSWVLYRSLCFQWNVHKHAKTPARANQILTNNAEFEKVANEVGANTPEEREKLRKALANIASSSNVSQPAQAENNPSPTEESDHVDVETYTEVKEPLVTPPTVMQEDNEADGQGPQKEAKNI
jgi:hypothetical protein